MNAVDEKQAKKNRWILLILFLLFLAPALGSWLLYLNRDKVSLGTTNRGEFVQPPRPMDLTGLDLPAGYFAHHLTLVYVSGPGCDSACRGALHVMQGTQLALGEQTSELRRLYLVEGKPDPHVADNDGGLMEADVSGKPVLKAFDGANSPKYIYLVDRNAYVVMRYALTQDPKFLLQDLRHLLGSGG